MGRRALDLRLQDSSASRTVTAGRGFFSQSDVGINVANNGNEDAIKGLSLWPNTDYTSRRQVFSMKTNTSC
ncbi:MAG: hypothetical protein ABMA02_18735, partial [Saprospiraceae bacterium]